MQDLEQRNFRYPVQQRLRHLAARVLGAPRPRPETGILNYYKTLPEIDRLYWSLQFKGKVLDISVYESTFSQYQDFEGNPVKAPYQVLVTPGGGAFWEDDQVRQVIEGEPEKSRLPLHTIVGGALYRFTVQDKDYYLKHLFLLNRAPYYLVGMRLLQQEGVQVAEPLIATSTRIVTAAAEGLSVAEFRADEKLQEKVQIYSDRLAGIQEHLIRRGQWLENYIEGPVFRLDVKDTHLFVRDLTHQDPLQWFTLIDAVQRVS